MHDDLRTMYVLMRRKGFTRALSWPYCAHFPVERGGGREGSPVG